MKKRSLFAAVAMLIVSAIVLTSATYAWFVAGQDAVAVTGLSASVSTNDGSLALRAKINNSNRTKGQGGTISGAATGAWKPSLSSTDFSVITGDSDTTHIIPTVLQPVDVDIDGENTVQIKTLEYDGSNFTGYDDAEANAGYQHYSFEVQLTVNSTTAGKKVTMTPEFTRGENFVYALVKANNQYYLYAESDSGLDAYDSYTPIYTFEASSGNTALVQDTATPKAIVTNSDTAATGTTFSIKNTPQTAQEQTGIVLFANQTATVTGTGNEAVTTTEFVKEVEVWIFAEGQDTGCIPRSIDASGIGIDFSFLCEDATP